MKSDPVGSTGEVGAAVVGAATGRGTFPAPAHNNLVTGRLQLVGSGDASAGHPVFTRNVGGQYVLQSWLNSLPLLVVDIVALTATIIACRLLFYQLGIPVGVDVSDSLIAIATGFVLINIELGLYPGVRLSPVEEFRRLIVSVSCVFIVWCIGVTVLTGSLAAQIWFLLAVWLVCFASLPICRGWTRGMLCRWTRWGVPVLVCGDDAGAVRLFQWLTDNRHLGLRPVGIIADPEAANIDINDARYAGPWSAAQQMAIENGVYWAIVIPRDNDTATLPQLIAEYLAVVPHIHVTSELTGLPDKGRIRQHLEGLAGIHLQQNLMLPLPRLMKRLLDLVVALTGGLLLLPLLFYIAVAVKLSSRGPILYGHERIGRGGHRFLAWKFRTMFANAGEVLELYLEAHPELREEWEKDHKLRYDPRITRIGRFLRVTSLDELPQLWNVIRGQMSLVGPRPIVTAEIPKYGAYYALYTMVTPGITGLWQVSGRNNTTYEERVQLDAYYVRNWSPWMDLYLLIRTVRIVLFAEGAY